MGEGDYSSALPKEYIGGHKTMMGIADDSNNLGGITGHLRAEGIWFSVILARSAGQTVAQSSF